MLDVYTSLLSQVKMSDLNFPLSFLTNVIRVQAPKNKRGIFVSNWCIQHRRKIADMHVYQNGGNILFSITNLDAMINSM